MTIDNRPLSGVSRDAFEARIPGSKSYTNRALIIAAQRPGTTEIVGALDCDDTRYLAQALNSFEGLKVSATATGFRVTRRPGPLGAPSQPLFLNGGGTPARFLMSFAISVPGKTIIQGNARLSERPMAHLLRAFDGMGVRYECLGKADCLPVAIHGGDIAGDTWRVDGSVSSQFLSSLLLAAAQQTTKNRIDIEVYGELVSKTYVDMTLESLRLAGIKASHRGYRVFSVTPGAPSAERIKVEVDASGMSYFLVAAAITKTKVRIPGIGKRSVQGDLGLAFALEAMGCRLALGEDDLTLEGRALKGIKINMEGMPDTVLSLAIAASEAVGETRITDIANLRVKECDRIHAAAAELERLGARVEEGADYLVIHPTARNQPADIQTYDDHRVAMSFGLLSLLHPGITIENPDCVAKSFPRFWNELERFRRHHEGPVGAKK